MSSETSLTTIAICQLVMILAATVLVGVVAWAVFAFKRLVTNKIDEAMAKVQPVVDQAKSIADQAKQTADTVSEKVDSIMTKADDTTSKVTEKVESVSTKLEEALTPQVVTVGGVIGAAAKCVELFKDASKLKKTAEESVSQEPKTDTQPEPE